MHQGTVVKGLQTLCFRMIVSGLGKGTFMFDMHQGTIVGGLGQGTFLFEPLEVVLAKEPFQMIFIKAHCKWFVSRNLSM